MSNLIKIANQGGNLVVSSRQIADDFEKEHNDTKKRIRELEKDMGKKSHNYFFIAEYKDSMNRVQEEYLMNRDGFSLLVMGFTGQKALGWKLKYIEAFNKMEEALIKQQKQITGLSKQQQSEARLNNSRARQANVLLKIANETDIKEYKQILHSHASKIVAGEQILPLPIAERKTYSAGEIGNKIGITANMVGRLANANNLKIEEYGKLFYDKSKYSTKQVESFRYYDNVIPVLEKLSKGVQ